MRSTRRPVSEANAAEAKDLKASNDGRGLAKPFLWHSVGGRLRPGFRARRFEQHRGPRHEVGCDACELFDQPRDGQRRPAVTRGLDFECGHQFVRPDRQQFGEKLIWGHGDDASRKICEVSDVRGDDNPRADRRGRGGDMPILRMVTHLRFKLFPVLDIGIRKGLLHQRAQRCSLGRIHAQVIGQVVHDFVKDPRGPVKTKTAGRGRAQQRVAQHHGEQNIGVEDCDQHRGLTINLAVLRLGLWRGRRGSVGGVVAFVAFARHIAIMRIPPRTSSGKKQSQSSEAVPALERTAAARIAALLSPKSAKGRGMLQVVDPKGQCLELPTTLTVVMYRAAELLAKGRPVAVLPEEEMLSTQEAADLLNVSRQYLVRLVDAGELAAVKVGSHRRLRVAEIVAFKAARDAKRASALDRLTGLSEEAGGYAIDPKRR